MPSECMLQLASFSVTLAAIAVKLMQPSGGSCGSPPAGAGALQDRGRVPGQHPVASLRDHPLGDRMKTLTMAHIRATCSAQPRQTS